MIGYLLGALFAGYLGDRFGRRKSLLFSTMLFSVMTFLAAFAPTMETLIVMRGLMGVGLGGALPGSYGALSEYTPPLVRGRYASWLGLIGNFSPPLGALLTVLVIPIFGWQAIFIGISLISLLAWLILWRYLPESPRWLASKGRCAEANEIVLSAERSFLQQGIELPEIDYAALLKTTQQEPTKKANWLSLFSKRMVKQTIAISAAALRNEPHGLHHHELDADHLRTAWHGYHHEHRHHGGHAARCTLRDFLVEHLRRQA